ncbi:hypothetical protein PC118_g9867 [Phytophthora cactorum]|uniref:EF-hand domain-containing protein n=1 Tax=Phytophthora cactorum TaxID=29920 RepID=A0A8T1G7J2_9STRA|nr:hypothetical protein PC118_g9867 [Phytophthora cactorum]
MALYSNAPCDPATCSPNSPLFDLEETRRQTWSSNLLRDLEARAPKPDGTSASTTALQYVAENSGFDVVTFRVDFSESASIKLHLPAEPGSAPINTLQKATQQLTFNCELHPFERRVLAYVVKRGKQRALVRVQYAVTAVVTPSVDAIVEGQERAAKMILQQLQRSNHIFNHVNKLKRLPYRPGAEVARACDEINRYLRDFGDIFVDASFPPQAKSLYDFDAPNKLSEVDSAVYTLCTWDHIHNITDASWTFVSLQRDSASTVAFTSGLPAQDSFLCALTIIAPYCELWLHRWFPTLDASSQFENMVAIPVALCDRGLTWQHVVVDLFFPSFPLGRVETDFSLTPLENNDSFQDLSDIHDGVSSKQVVITLNAGEYVVTVSAERPGRSESHSTAEKAVLTPASVDANLQLVFDCLDREGRQELSESDISNFLLQYEHMTPSQRGKGALRSFLHQHGSSSSFGSEERRITLDDFREIYLVQAIQDSHEDLANYSISSKTISSASVRARFQELVWQDLLRLLPSSSSGVDLPAENPRTELKRRDIVDLVCCFHSDTPLLNVVALPEDKSSIDSNNFNI